MLTDAGIIEHNTMQHTHTHACTYTWWEEKRQIIVLPANGDLLACFVTMFIKAANVVTKCARVTKYAGSASNLMHFVTKSRCENMLW